MKRPLSFLVATAIAASAIVWSAAPSAAAAKMAPTASSQGGILLVSDHDWRNNNRHDDNWRHHRRHRDHDNFFFPGFSFSFGTPYAYAPAYYPQQQDCFRDRYGRLYCSAY